MIYLKFKSIIMRICEWDWVWKGILYKDIINTLTLFLSLSKSLYNYTIILDDKASRGGVEYVIIKWDTVYIIRLLPISTAN